MPTNPNISLSFTAGKFQSEIKSMTDSLKSVKKEFEISNLAIEAQGKAIDLDRNKIEGYMKQVELQKGITSKITEAVQQASSAHQAAAQRVEAAKLAYDKASQSENTSKEELKKLKTELEKAENTYNKLGNSVKTWTDKLQNSQVAEGKLRVAISQTNADIEKQNKGLAENIKSTQNVTSATGQLFNVYNLIKGLAIGYAGKKLFDTLIGSNADLEMNKAAFESLLGGADAAQKKLDELYTFAAKTPFTFAQTTEAEKRLLAYGVAAQDTGKILQMLGDISMGVPEKLDRISLAYGQVVTAQKLYGTELRQFAENGVPLLAELAKMYGVTEAKMRDMVEAGQISDEAVTAALANMTSEGGKFYGMMDKTSKAMQGEWSTLADTFNLFARDVGEESFQYLKGELDSFLGKIDEMSKSGQLSELAKEWGHSIAEFVKFIVDAVKVLWDMRNVLIAAAEAYAAFKVSMAIGGAIMSVVNAIETYTRAMRAGLTATTAMNAALSVNPWVLLASAVAAVVVGIIGYNVATQGAESETQKLIDKTKDLTDEYKQNIEAASKSSDSQLAEASIADKLTNELDGLSKKINKTVDDKRTMVSIVDQLNKKIPNLNLSINAETGELNKQIPAVKDAISAWRELLFVQASQKVSLSAAQSILDLEKQKKDLEDQIKGIQDKMPKFQTNVVGGSAINLDEDKANIEILTENIKTIDKQISEANKEIDDAQKRSEEYVKKYGSLDQGKSNGPPKPPPLITNGDKAAKDAEKKRQEAIKKQFDDLKYSLDMGYITEADYYNKLAALRDKYFKKGSSEWQQYTLEIKKYNDSLKKDAFDKALNDLQYQKDMGVITEAGYYKKLAELRDKYLEKDTAAWRQYTVEIKSYNDKAKEEAIQKEHDEFEKRRQISDKWIADQKTIGKLTSDEEIAAYERIKKYVQEYYAQGIIDAEEYHNQLIELEKDEYKIRQQAIQDEIKSINSLNDKIISSLQKKYQEAEKLQQDSIQNEFKNLDTWKDKNLKSINDVYSAKEKAIEDAAKLEEQRLQAELDALDESQKQNDRQGQDAEDIKKINDLKDMIAYEHDAFNKAELQKQLDQLVIDRQKRLDQEALDDKKDTLKKQINIVKDNADKQKDLLEEQKQAELDKTQVLYDAEKASIEQRKADWDAFYKDKLSNANLQAEAEKLIMQNSQNEIIELLKGYVDEYKITGQTLGEKLVEGFKTQVDAIASMVSNVINQINTAKSEAASLNASKPTASTQGNTATIGQGVGAGAIGASISVQNTFNTPVQSPADVARVMRQTLQQLVGG